jgi:Zn-dependent protease
LNGVPIARIFGFEIRIHLSWVLIIAVITILAQMQAETAAPSMAAPVRWAVGAIIAGAFLLSVLAHELAHGIAARRLGLDVGPITLYFFGGSASFQLEAQRPRDEIAIALAGPAVSLALGSVLGLLGIAGSATSIPVVQAIGGIALVLAALNLVLGGANLVPAYPLDGGRIVRAAVWARTGDERRGATAAAITGRAVGWLMMGAGLVVAVVGDILDGMMVALSGWFLGNASRGIERRLAVQELLEDVRVGDVMERTISAIPANLTLDTFAERLLGADEPAALPVVNGDEIVGVIGAAQVRRLPRRQWPRTRAEDIMIAPPALPLLRAGDTLWSALDGLRRTGLEGLPVVEGEGLLGVVTRRAVLATIHERAVLRGVSLR